MRFRKYHMLGMAAAAAGLSLAGCADNDADQPVAADTMATDTSAMGADAAAVQQGVSDHAAQFLTEAMKGDNSEVRVGKLAAAEGSSQQVKDFGQMLMNDHGTHLDKVKAMATEMNVPTTDETKAEADVLYAKLQGMDGTEFDKTFKQAMIEDHKKDIAAYQEEANSNDAQAVTSMAKDTIPTLQKHLDTAQALP